MVKFVIFMVTSLFYTAVLATPPRVTKQYRTDYEYNRKTDAFYKFHAESRLESTCREICEMEGATVMLVESHEDLVQVHGMFKKFPDLPNYAWAAQDGQHHESAEEQPLIYLSQEQEDLKADHCTVVSRRGVVHNFACHQLLPFFCKVKANDAQYDSRCDVYGTSYQYIPSVGSCYKVPSTAYSWNEAYAECRAEGSHLLVVNSLAESRAVQNLARNIRVKGSGYPWLYIAGFRAAPPQGNETPVFKTIFNQTLEEAGYSVWSPNEPNNIRGNEFCGSYFQDNGKLNDISCSDTYGFICEKELQKTT